MTFFIVVIMMMMMMMVIIIIIIIIIIRGSLYQIRRNYTVSLLLHFNSNTPFMFFI